MRRLDYWIGVLIVSAAVLCHALFPRYALVTIDGYVFRVDRWSGLPVGTSIASDDRHCAVTIPAG